MQFSRTERNAIITLGVVAGFVVSVDQVVKLQGTLISIDYTQGIFFMLLAMIGMVISVFIHDGAHKFVARSIGYYTHIENYVWGIVAGGALSIFSFGWIQFFTPNTLDLEADPRARIAKFRKYENWKQEAYIAAAGIAATAVVAVSLHAMYVWTDSLLIRKLMLGNIWLMVFSLLPFELLNLYSLRLLNTIPQLPQSDGLYLLHYSIFAWVFASVFVLALSMLLYFFASPILSVALIIATITTLSVWWHLFKG